MKLSCSGPAFAQLHFQGGFQRVLLAVECEITVVTISLHCNHRAAATVAVQ